MLPDAGRASASSGFAACFACFDIVRRKLLRTRLRRSEGVWNSACHLSNSGGDMNQQIFVSAAILFVLAQTAGANPVSRRATITGGGGNGRCSVQVSVDHTAEVEVSGDMGLLTTTAGQPASWRRFQCNAPLPSNPVDFRFSKTQGRGTVRMVQDPRRTGGRAVIHISDTQGGRSDYTFDLQWRGPFGGGWAPGPSVPPGPPSGHWPGPGGGLARAMEACQDSVTHRLNGDGYRYVAFDRMMPADNPGRNDWITGRATGTRDFRTTHFSFSCSVDYRSGTVRWVDVRRR